MRNPTLSSFFFLSILSFPLETRIFRSVLSKKKNARAMKMHNPRPNTVMLVQIHRRAFIQQVGEVGGPPFSSYFSFAPWKRSFDCVNGIRNKSWRRRYVRRTYVVIMSSTTSGIFSNCRQMDTELLEGRRNTLRLQIVFPGESLWESLNCSCLE